MMMEWFHLLELRLKKKINLEEEDDRRVFDFKLEDKIVHNEAMKLK